MRSVAFAPADVNLLAVGDSYGGITLWNLATRKQQDRFHQSGGVSCLAFTADGATLASGSYNDDKQESLKLRTIGQREPKATLKGPKSVLAIAFSADGKRLAAGDNDKTIKVWNPASGQVEATLTGHAGDIHAVVFAPDSNTLISAGKDRTIRVWDVTAAKETAKLQGHDDEINELALSSDGKLLASGSKDKTVRLWELPGGKPIATITDAVGEAAALALTPDGKTLAIGPNLKLWDVAAARTKFPPTAVSTDPIAALKRLNADIKLDDDGKISLFDHKILDDDLALLKGFKNLRILHISSSSITDAGMVHLAGLTQLQELTVGSILARPPKITDAGLVHLKGLSNLRNLNLMGTLVTGTGLAQLPVGITDLDLANTKLNDAGLASLARFTKLETLNLYQTAITGKDFAQLKGLTRLKCLVLAGCKGFDDAGLLALRDMKQLAHLNLKGTQVTDAGILYLKELAKVTLDTEETKVTPAGLRALRASQAAGNPIGYIEALGGNVDRDDLKPDKPVVGLVLGNKFASDDLAYLKQFPRLERLRIIGADITDARLAQLSHLLRLTVLSLDATKIDGSGLVHLKNLTRLNNLQLSKTELKDASLAHLAGLTKLTQLDLSHTPMNGAGLAHLKNLVNLEDLNLSGTKVTDDALAHLKPFVKLTRLDLKSTLIDQGPRSGEPQGPARPGND